MVEFCGTINFTFQIVKFLSVKFFIICTIHRGVAGRDSVIFRQGGYLKFIICTIRGDVAERDVVFRSQRDCLKFIICTVRRDTAERDIVIFRGGGYFAASQGRRLLAVDITTEVCRSEE